jgi:hypothetical protein
MNEVSSLAKQNIGLLSNMESLINGDLYDVAKHAQLAGMAVSCVDRLSVEEQDAMITATREVFPKLNSIRERLVKAHQAVWNVNTSALEKCG